MIWIRRPRKFAKPRAAPWDWIRENHPLAAQLLDAMSKDQNLHDVDYARILKAAEMAASDPHLTEHFVQELTTLGAGTALHSSGLRTLPGSRFAMHNMLMGQVRLGRVVPTAKSELVASGDFGVDQDVLRTSLLVIGPPGSGKSRSLAIPIVEHLSLSALANRASLIVVDPKGTDFAYDGWFDIVVDPLNPSCGFSLFGGAPTADIAADRLASALLPPKVSDDKAYFVDASYNALYACLAPFHEAFERWPTIRELLGLLRADRAAMDSVKQHLKGPGSKDWKNLLDTRSSQAGGRVDPAASLVERFARLDRPALRRIFDHPESFLMRDINRPTRVRVAVPESEYPEASRILARLVVSQFVQVTAASDTNRNIFKALVIDEAGRYVDDYVARGVQKLRSNNAGLVLLTQTLSDFPLDVRPTIFGSTGCKAVFGGVDPADADQFSKWFGDHYVSDVTVTRGQSASVRYDFGTVIDRPTGYQRGETRSSSTRRIERARWTPSDIITGVPSGHCLMALARSNGHRVGPVLIDLRA